MGAVFKQVLAPILLKLTEGPCMPVHCVMPSVFKVSCERSATVMARKLPACV